jgi:hypothetical protein
MLLKRDVPKVCKKTGKKLVRIRPMTWFDDEAPVR